MEQLKIRTIWPLIRSENIQNVYDFIELMGVWFACVWGILLSSTAYVLLYWKSKLKRHRLAPEAVATEDTDAMLSVIIAGTVMFEFIRSLYLIAVAHNEAENIRECVERLAKHTKVR